MLPETTAEQSIHQAKSHLAVIWGYVQLLMEKIPKHTPESEWLEKIALECQQLQQKLEEAKSKTA